MISVRWCERAALLAALVLSGCFASAEAIRKKPMEEGSQEVFQADLGLVRKAALAAVIKAHCRVEEDRRLNDRSHMIIGLTPGGMLSSGVWLRVVLRDLGDGKTSAHYLTEKRDPNDAFAQKDAVWLNFSRYLRGNVEEALLDGPAPEGTAP